MVKILHPEWITVEADGKPHKGYNQEWYPQRRQQGAGCGPTVGSMLAAYLLRKEKNVPIRTREEAVMLMLRMWQFATPSRYGMYRTSWLRDGLIGFMKENGLRGRVRSLPVSAIRPLRPGLGRAAAFIDKGLAGDEPVAFLNLHSGSEPIPFPWHWMPIVGSEADGSDRILTLWDEGKTYTFSLGKWLKTTLFGGGFVAIEPK